MVWRPVVCPEPQPVIEWPSVPGPLLSYIYPVRVDPSLLGAWALRDSTHGWCQNSAFASLCELHLREAQLWECSFSLRKACMMSASDVSCLPP